MAPHPLLKEHIRGRAVPSRTGSHSLVIARGDDDCGRCAHRARAISVMGAQQKSIEAEQTVRLRFVVTAGHPSPLPPCLAGHVGRSRYADRLRPDFLFGHSGARPGIHNHDSSKPWRVRQFLASRGYGFRARGQTPAPRNDGMATPSVAARPVAARAGVPCGRRTALGSPPPRPRRAGTVLRSGTPAPAADR
jgi:hypothetical protein